MGSLSSKCHINYHTQYDASPNYSFQFLGHLFKSLLFLMIAGMILRETKSSIRRCRGQCIAIQIPMPPTRQASARQNDRIHP